jgi:tRNA nucleotidyltransferase (CCA-adding enzyme)
MNEAFKLAVPLLEVIEKSGYEAYFVGGSVRDLLLGRENDDVDIASSATPAEIKQLFPKTVDIGIEHGTVLVLYNGQSYEITTFRSESEYEDFRRPKKVEFIRSIYADLQRRDFTMNAIAMTRSGDLVDPFLGAEAIRNKVIETVGAAKERFSEDALRMLRAIRFVSQLSFDVNEQTFSALKDNGYLLKNISVERKTKEFEKLLSGGSRLKSLDLLLKARLYRYLPGLNEAETSIRQLLTYNCEKLNIYEMWAILIDTMDIQIAQYSLFLKEWRLSNQKIKKIEKILLFLQNRKLTYWNELSLFQAGEEISLSTEKLFNVLNGLEVGANLEIIKNSFQELPIKNRGELAISGQDLMEWLNRRGGPWVKELLGHVEEAVLRGKLVNDKEAIREWLDTCNLK